MRILLSGLVFLIVRYVGWSCRCGLASCQFSKQNRTMAHSKVSFSEKVSCEFEIVREEDTFDYVESTSELGSSDDDEDAGKLEAIFGAVYSGLSPSKPFVQPAERHSLLLWDKDLGEEDLESGIVLLFLSTLLACLVKSKCSFTLYPSRNW